MMPEFEVKKIDGAQMVKELQSEVYFYTLEAYANLSDNELRDIEQKAREAVEGNPGDQVPSKYQILDLGIVGAKGIRGQYLIPAELAFYWLMTDCRTKAMLIGGETLAEAVKAQFNAIEEPIRQGKTVRLKEGVKPVPVLEFHKHHEHFNTGDLGIVLEYPTPQIYAGYPENDAIILFKRWGKKEPLKVRVNINDLELMED